MFLRPTKNRLINHRTFNPETQMIYKQIDLLLIII
jgi:hypothetical protein